jgi:hypothetical protein
MKTPFPRCEIYVLQENKHFNILTVLVDVSFQFSSFFVQQPKESFWVSKYRLAHSDHFMQSLM